MAAAEPLSLHKQAAERGKYVVFPQQVFGIRCLKMAKLLRANLLSVRREYLQRISIRKARCRDLTTT